MLIDRWQRTRGMTVRDSANDRIFPEAVRDNWDAITDFKNPLYPKGSEVMTYLLRFQFAMKLISP